MIDLEKVHELPTDAIIVREGFNRVREDVGDIKELADSIKVKGQIHPILITDANELIAGGRRLLACKLLGIMVKAIYRSDVSDLDLRELELEENLMRKDLTWHEKNAMIKEITELKQSVHGVGGPGKNKGDGWSKQSTAELLNVSRGAVSQAISMAEAVQVFPQLKTAESENEARKMLQKLEEQAILTVLQQRKDEVAPAGVKVASESYIIKDALQGLRELAAEQFDFADVDTPYGVNFNQIKDAHGISRAADYTEWTPKQYMENVEVVIREVYRVLKADGWMIFWPSMKYLNAQTPELRGKILGLMHDVGFKVDPVPNIWDCGDTGLTLEPNSYLGRAYDMFLACRKGNAVVAKPGRSNMFRYPRVKEKIHDAEKPIELMVDIVKTYCFPGAHGVVPFMGSGNSVRALIRHGGTGLGFDKSEDSKLRFMLKVEEDAKANG